MDDFTCLPDLAPTFFEAGKIDVPKVMSAKSLWPVLKSKKQGLVDKSRDAAITGRERHVHTARPGYLPYPHRSIRPKDYQFIINFKPDRWPLGDPYRLGSDDEPSYSSLESTLLTIQNMHRQSKNCGND